MRNKVCSGQVTIPAYSSVVLLKDIATVDTPAGPGKSGHYCRGLDYQYYEGSWSTLPDFNTLTPAKSGTVATPDPAVRSRTDQYAIQFKGYINVPTDGTYTFYTSSDDGSKLLIGTTEVVNNDGVHAAIEKSGTIGLKAGKHALTILYFQGNGGQALTVSYEGPGIIKQTIPATAMYRIPAPATSGGNGTGLLGTYFNNASLTAPSALNQTDATVNFDWGTSSPAPGVNADNFSVRWTGQVQAPVTGSYTFSTTSDDGVRLWVNGTQLVNNWNAHASTINSGSPITLTAGQRYTVVMEYYDGGGGAVAKLLWAYTGQAQQAVPQGYLYPATVVAAAPTTVATSTGIYLSDLNWVTATNGYGPAEKDRSNGESNAGDGKTITLNGVTYAKGLGVHAPSEITYNLNGQYTRFLTDVGIDDEINSGCGTVSFDVYVDNILVYSSGVMTPTSATKSIDLNVSGKQTLKLVATTGGDGNTCDHADWAGARLVPLSGARTATSETNEFSPLESGMHIYPIPAQNRLTIRYYAETAGEAMVQLTSIGALPVSRTLHQVTPGENIIQIAVDQLNRGNYVLTLSQNNQRLSRKVILTE